MIFGRKRYNQGFNEGQADGIAAATALVKQFACPIIESRIDADIAEIRALKTENELLKKRIADLEEAAKLREAAWGEAVSREWIPHQRETWPWRIGKLLSNTVFREWHGHGADPEFTERIVPAGTLVKIVMVSRMGDVGITDDLSAEQGYQARVPLDHIENARAKEQA